MCVVGPDLDLTLVVYTGWYLPETGKVHDYSPDQFGLLVWHSQYPRHESQIPNTSPCERWEACYSSEGYSAARDPINLLIREGSDAAWEWLETELRSEQTNEKRGAV
jgi:hypothetical protein